MTSSWEAGAGKLLLGWAPWQRAAGQLQPSMHTCTLLPGWEAAAPDCCCPGSEHELKLPAAVSAAAAVMGAACWAG